MPDPQKLTVSDRWKAVRKGHIYCAPACGRGCTYGAYVTAKRRANALALKMGKGWLPYVWENLGWHYQVELPTDVRMEIHARHYSIGKASYTAFVHHVFVVTADDPHEALAAAVELLRNEHDKFTTALNAVSKAVRRARS